MTQLVQSNRLKIYGLARSEGPFAHRPGLAIVEMNIPVVGRECVRIRARRKAEGEIIGPAGPRIYSFEVLRITMRTSYPLDLEDRKSTAANFSNTDSGHSSVPDCRGGFDRFTLAI